MTKLTYAQAEVIAYVFNDGGWKHGFFKHEVFQNQDNLDNARRRTLRRLIDRGVAVETGTTDIEGNPQYVFPMDAVYAAASVLDEDW